SCRLAHTPTPPAHRRYFKYTSRRQRTYDSSASSLSSDSSSAPARDPAPPRTIRPRATEEPHTAFTLVQNGGVFQSQLLCPFERHFQAPCDVRSGVVQYPDAITCSPPNCL